MSRPHDSDQQFHENLHTLGSGLSVPETVPSELRLRCLGEFSATAAPRFAMLRRPALLSTLGLAACLAVAFGLLFPTNPSTTVQAATILKKFDEQLAEPKLLEITLESIVLEEMSVNGRLQVSDTGIAGDLHVVVTEAANQPGVDIDLALGISPAQSWVLIRGLQIPDQEAQPIVQWLFPPGAETLLLLPTEAVEDFDIDIADDLRELGSGELVEVFKRLVDAQSETGATITKGSDGMIILTLPIEDTKALEELMRITSEGDDDIQISIETGEGELDDDDLKLIGSTIEFVYDPETELIRSFTITDFGAAKGRLSVVISGEEMDPTLLDPQRVTTPNTRTLDLGMLTSLFESLEHQVEESVEEE